MEVLKAHDWPGNIRELQNFIERAVLFSPGSVLRLPLRPEADGEAELGERFTHACRRRSGAHSGNIEANRLADRRAGRSGHRLGLPRTTLVYKMRKLGIETRRSLRARPIQQLADEQCHAAANC